MSEIRFLYTRLCDDNCISTLVNFSGSHYQGAIEYESNFDKYFGIPEMGILALLVDNNNLELFEKVLKGMYKNCIKN